MQIWITPEEAAPHTPWKSRANIYERIREGKFPFRYKRSGRSILIFAPDLGLIPEVKGENDEAQNQVETVEATA
jgi:hypothetical protein